MYEEILRTIDHTQLKQTATWQDIQQLCDEAAAFGCASVCIPPDYVQKARQYSDITITTVVGFPNGYQTTATKVAEARELLTAGADELDMVINLARVKSGDWATVRADIAAVREQCEGKILKVIIETALIEEAEKIKLCEIITETKADYIKTSTGFASGGATIADILLFKEHIGAQVKIKAAGGIRTIETAQALLSAGADRLGASSLLAQIKAAQIKE